MKVKVKVIVKVKANYFPNKTVMSRAQPGTRKLGLILYKDIIKRAKQFDHSPEYKVGKQPVELESVLGANRFYTPNPQKFVDIARQRFKENVNAADISAAISLGFSALKDLNSIYNRLHPKLTTENKLAVSQQVASSTANEEPTTEALTEGNGAVVAKDFIVVPTNEVQRASYWAHATTDITSGKLLIAHPLGCYGDDTFHNATILITKHDNSAQQIQTFGLVLNKPFTREEAIKAFVAAQGTNLHHTSAIQQQHRFQAQKSMPITLQEASWFAGGPVKEKLPQPTSLHGMRWINALYKGGKVVPKGATKITDDIFAGGDYWDLCKYIERKELTPEDTRLFIGCCTWEPKQLQGELDKGIWVTADASSDLLFPSVGDTKSHWQTVLTSMGGEYASFPSVSAMIGNGLQPPKKRQRIVQVTVPVFTS